MVEVLEIVICKPLRGIIPERYSSPRCILVGIDYQIEEPKHILVSDPLMKFALKYLVGYRLKKVVDIHFHAVLYLRRVLPDKFLDISLTVHTATPRN